MNDPKGSERWQQNYKHGGSWVECCAHLSRAMALKLSTVTEQQSFWKNLTALHTTRTCSHQQQRGLTPSAMSKGTHARPVQMPEQARFLMKRLVTGLKTLVEPAHHNMVTLPAEEKRGGTAF